MALGGWPNKYLKSGADSKVRPHGAILHSLRDGFATVVPYVAEVHSKPRDCEISQDKGGKYIVLFGGVKFYFDDVMWFDDEEYSAGA